MKRSSRLFVAILLVVFLLIGAGAGAYVRHHSSVVQAEAGQPAGPVGVDVDGLRDRMGILFSPADASLALHVKITKDEAIKLATSSIPPSQTPSEIVVDLGTLSPASQGTQMSALTAPRLVWFVQYRGVVERSAGPPGAPVSYSTESDVVVDAVTGEVVMGLVYR